MPGRKKVENGSRSIVANLIFIVNWKCAPLFLRLPLPPLNSGRTGGDRLCAHSLTSPHQMCDSRRPAQLAVVPRTACMPASAKLRVHYSVSTGKPTRHENRYGDHMQWRIQQKVCRHTCQSMYSFTQTTGPRICHFQFCSRPASQKHRKRSQGIVQDSLHGHGQLERELPPCSYSTNSDKSLIRNWTIQYMHRNNGAMFTEIFAYWNLQLNARIGIYYWNSFRSDCADKVSLCIISMKPIVCIYHQQVLVLFLSHIKLNPN